MVSQRRQQSHSCMSQRLLKYWRHTLDSPVLPCRSHSDVIDYCINLRAANYPYFSNTTLTTFHLGTVVLLFLGGSDRPTTSAAAQR